MNTPKASILNTLTRLTLTATALAAAPEIACSPKGVQIMQTNTHAAVEDALAPDEILVATKKAQAIYAKIGSFYAKHNEFENAAFYFEEADEKQKANEYYKKAAEKSEKEGDFIPAGHAYKEAGQLAKAQELYLKGAQEAEKEKKWLTAGLAYAFAGQPKKGANLVMKDPMKDPANYALVAECYEEAGLKKEAVQAYALAAQYFENRNGRLKDFAIIYYRKAGMQEKADEILSRMLDDAGEFGVAEEAIAIAGSIDDKDLYRNYGDEVAQKRVEEGEYMEAGALYEKMQHWAAAKRCYEQYISIPVEKIGSNRGELDENEAPDLDPLDEPEEETPVTALGGAEIDVDEKEADAYMGIVRALKHLKK